ncbi:MAG: hypothetical protein JEY96_11830 [Bacteroidales bacterium]|nr:hypothetical protein [Bacteroidales bacterium]
MRRNFVLLLSLNICLSFLLSCEKETIYPDYHKYRIKNIYSKSQSNESGFGSKEEYIYNHNSTIDRINLYYNTGKIDFYRTFGYSNGKLSTIKYFNVNSAGYTEIKGIDFLIYSKVGLLQEVLFMNKDGREELLLTFVYNDDGRVSKKFYKNMSSDYFSEIEEFLYDQMGNIIQRDQYIYKYDSDELESSVTELYKYDTWVNPYFNRGFIGIYCSWPISPNNVVERIDRKTELEDKTYIFYYEYLRDGYPIKTNSTLHSLDAYTEFEYENS